MKSSEFWGCQDHSCLIQEPRQGTNGGRCLCGIGKVRAYIECLRNEKAVAEKKLAIAVEGLDRLSIHGVQSSYRCIDEQGPMSDMDEAFEGGYIEARDQFHAIAQEVREKIEEVK